MKRKSFYYICMFIATAFVVSACEDIIDVDLRSVEPRLVIEGTIRMDDVARVRITKTKDFGSTNEYVPINNAVVTVEDDAGNKEQLNFDESGSYIAGMISGVENRTYKLTVVYEEKEYTATSFMPPVVEIDSLTLWKFPMTDYPYPMVHFVDPKGQVNEYYRYVVYVNGERPDKREKLFSAEFTDGSIIREPLFVRSEDEDEDAIHQGDEITVEMQCVDKDVYTFFSTLSMVENNLTNPTSNIKGGALGYFGAYSFARKSITAEWDW